MFLCCLLYFGYVVGSLQWPTPSDAINHGQNTAQIIDDQRIFNIQYPSGFHITAANLALSLNLYVGESILILAAAIMILIPLVLFSLSYIHTNSLILSLLAFMSPFLINSSLELEHWMLSSFFIGRYAAIYGYLAIFTFCVLISLEKPNSNILHVSSLVSILLVSLVLFITYPTFVIFVGIFFIYWGIANVRMLSNFLISISGKMKILLLFGLISFCLLVLFVFFQSDLLARIFRFMDVSYEYLGLNVNYFYDWRFSFIIFLGIGIASFQIIKKQSLNFNVFFLILSIPILLSLIEVFFPYFVLLLPKRSILMVSALSWIFFPILINSIIFKSSIEKRDAYLVLGLAKSRKIKFQNVIGFFVSIVLLSQLAPTVLPNLSFMQANAQYADWFVKQKGFTTDFEALEWIHWNIPSQDLILNDLSYASFYLRSFSIKNIGVVYQLTFQNESDILDYIEIWKRPEDVVYLKKIIEIYEMKYILVTAEPRFFDFIRSKTDRVAYTHKFYTPAEYIAIFNTYPFLSPIFRKGQSVIYRISS
jgi:hypothetical protein